MKYYRMQLSQYPDYETLILGPPELAQILQANPAVSQVRECSRSTFYRLRREDARRFWSGLEQHVFEDTP